MTIRELMDSGRLYAATGEGFPEEQLRCKELVYEFNRAHPRDEQTRQKILRELLGDMGETVWIEPPFHLEFGYRTHIGSFFYANFNLVIVDDVDVYIGDYVMIAPNVTITATGHPVHPDLRIHGEQFSLPVHIQDHVWIGSNAVILPGVTIGKNSVIGAGSVVTHDIPPDVVAVGSPCRVLRPITQRDREFYYKNRRVND